MKFIKVIDPEFDSVLQQFGLTPESYEKMSIEELASIKAEV